MFHNTKSKDELRELVHKFIDDNPRKTSKEEWAEFKAACLDYYQDNIYVLGDTPTIYNIELADFVDRDSDKGYEAEGIQMRRSFNTWFKKHNISKRFTDWKKHGEVYGIDE